MTMANNLKFNKRLKKKFEDDYCCVEYPKFDNYDAIEVPFTDCIPSDYDGVMGVPITFLDKYNPDQFVLLGIQDRDDEFRTKIYSKDEYSNASDLNRAGVIIVNGIPVMPYRRLFIRRKEQL